MSSSTGSNSPMEQSGANSPLEMPDPENAFDRLFRLQAAMNREPAERRLSISTISSSSSEEEDNTEKILKEIQSDLHGISRDTAHYGTLQSQKFELFCLDANEIKLKLEKLTLKVDSLAHSQISAKESRAQFSKLLARSELLQINMDNGFKALENQLKALTNTRQPVVYANAPWFMPASPIVSDDLTISLVALHDGERVYGARFAVMFDQFDCPKIASYEKLGNYWHQNDYEELYPNGPLTMTAHSTIYKKWQRFKAEIAEWAKNCGQGGSEPSDITVEWNEKKRTVRPDLDCACLNIFTDHNEGHLPLRCKTRRLAQEAMLALKQVIQFRHIRDVKMLLIPPYN